MRYDNAKDLMLFVGQIVWWYPYGDVGQEPHAGVVTKINPHTIDITTWSPGNKDGKIRGGVRHMTDPSKASDEVKQMGSWEHTRQTKMLMDVLGVKQQAKAAPANPPAQPQAKSA